MPTKPKPRLEIVYLDPKKLKHDPKNVRKHSKAQIEKLRASIREFGFTNPLLLKPGNVVGAGNARLDAAIAEEVPLVPTITLKLSEKQWRQYAIADNGLAAFGSSWDKELLGGELKALAKLDLDVTGLGFDVGTLATFGVPGFSPDRGGKGPAMEMPATEILIVIECKSEKQQTDLLKRFQKEGLTCRALL